MHQITPWKWLPFKSIQRNQYDAKKLFNSKLSMDTNKQTALNNSDGIHRREKISCNFIYM